MGKLGSIIKNHAFKFLVAYFLCVMSLRTTSFGQTLASYTIPSEDRNLVLELEVVFVPEIQDLAESNISGPGLSLQYKVLVPASDSASTVTLWQKNTLASLWWVDRQKPRAERIYQINDIFLLDKRLYVLEQASGVIYLKTISLLNREEAISTVLSLSSSSKYTRSSFLVQNSKLFFLVEKRHRTVDQGETQYFVLETDKTEPVKIPVEEAPEALRLARDQGKTSLHRTFSYEDVLEEILPKARALKKIDVKPE